MTNLKSDHHLFQLPPRTLASLAPKLDGLGLEVEKAQTYNQVMLLLMYLSSCSSRDSFQHRELMDDLVVETCFKIIYRAMAIIY